MHLVNSTAFEACAVPLVSHRDTHCIAIAVKGTFALGPAGAPLTLAEEPVPLHLEDVYWGEPAASSLKYETDIVIGKPGTDVALIGAAHAPAGPVRQLDVGIRIGALQKIVRVFGDRVWRKARGSFTMSEPEAFETMPLVYENAYGGADPSRGYCEQNPVGKGFVSAETLPDVDGVPAPNLELPEQPIKSLDERPEPAGFGFIARHWQPRRALAGTYDEAWSRERCPLLPTDFDERSHAAASPGLASGTFLAGGERVVIVNASAAGRLEFTLPAHVLGITASIAGRRSEEAMRLDTVVIEPAAGWVTLTWRASLECHWNLSMVEWIKVSERG